MSLPTTGRQGFLLMRSRPSCRTWELDGAKWGGSREQTPALPGVSFLFRQIPSGFSPSPQDPGENGGSRSKRLVSAAAGKAGRVCGHSWAGAAGRPGCGLRCPWRGRLCGCSGFCCPLDFIPRPRPGLPWDLTAQQGFAPPALHQGQEGGGYGQEGTGGEPGRFQACSPRTL